MKKAGTTAAEMLEKKQERSDESNLNSNNTKNVDLYRGQNVAKCAGKTRKLIRKNLCIHEKVRRVQRLKYGKKRNKNKKTYPE